MTAAFPGQTLKIQFLPAIPGTNAAGAAADAARSAADAAASAASIVADVADKVKKTGDTMTGFLVLNADPVSPLQASTKQYVDAHGGGGGGGNVSNSGVPVLGQLASWVSNTQIQGINVSTITGSLAPINSPALTGNPTAPTPATNDNDTSISTTAYVQSNLALYAPIANPNLTGVPTAPTAATADNSNQIANTAFVKASLTTSAVITSGTTNLSGAHNGQTLFLDASTGNITLNFPATGSLPTDWFVYLLRTDNTANTVTAVPVGTIDGRATARLINQYDVAAVQKAGSNYVTRDAKWRKRIVLYSSGANTFTVANEVPLGCNSYVVEGWGGGGAGGGADPAARTGAGGGGAWGMAIVPTSLDTTLSCTVGAGGAAVGSGGGFVTGNPGGSTTITGTNLGTLTAPGGGGGSSSGGGASANPTGSWMQSIMGGQGSLTTSTSDVPVGGSSPNGGGGGAVNVGNNGIVPGGGGCCGNHAGGPSGAGAAGRIVITI